MKLECIKHFLLIGLILLSSKVSFSQFIENFNDSNFNKNPVWYGDTSKFSFSMGKLRSASTVANDKFYISSKSKLVSNTIWSFYTNLQLNTSSLNYTDIFLTSDSVVLTGQNSGYFVRLGGTNDEISLYKKIKNTSTILIDGKNGSLNHSNNIFKIKVICDSNFNFTLYRDSTGTGNNYITEGTSINSELKSSEFAGIVVKQSTSSFFKLHFFDDIEISKIHKDTTLPLVKNIEMISLDTIRVSFSEKMNFKALDFANFEIDKGIGTPFLSKFIDKDSTIVDIVFSKKLLPNVFYNLKIKDCPDYSGLMLKDTTFNIIKHKYEMPCLYDLLISEIMADPEPQVNLPNAEFIEIYNNSTKIITLEKCRIYDNTSFSVLPNVQIYPDSFLIICDKSNENLFKKYGNTIGVSYFPTMNNDGEEITIRNAKGELIHRINYSEKSYLDNYKSNGGWTLEMIDYKNPCNESNFIASKNQNGGTPGKSNSVTGFNPDIKKPVLKDVFIKSKLLISLVFDGALDSNSAVSFNNYILSNNTISKITSNNNEVELLLTKDINSNAMYKLEILKIKDCSGNELNDTNIDFSFPETPINGDIILNEILFNPKSGGSDYVEIFNNSSNTISLKNLYLFNYNEKNEPDNFSIIDTSGRYILPWNYKVFSISPDWICANYKNNDKTAFIQLGSMPAMDDDFGHIGISDKWKNVIDEMDYNKSMHYELLTETEGVALEKINNKLPSFEISNWTSAAASYGYGTPGMENSHYINLKNNKNFLNISPLFFTPDEDGIDDIISISLNCSKPNYQATLIIFDINGFEIKKLANNIPLGNTQTWFWDGLDNNGKKTSIGIYIVYAEIFGLDGKKITAKKTLTLGGK